MKRKLPAESFDFYVSIGIGRSYSAVADHYGASKGAVTAIASKHDWQGRLGKIEREARSKADEKAVETLEQVNERHIKAARVIQAKALEALRGLSLDSAMEAVRAFSTEPWWGDHMRMPIAEDAAVYGLNQTAI